MTKVSIVYGWAEGPAHSRKLRDALANAGFTIAGQLEEADILIAHSGGGLVLPLLSKAQLVVLVGLPFWPHKYPLISAGQKFFDDLIGRGGRWVKRNTYYLVYTITQPKRLFEMWHAWKRANFVLPQTPEFLLIKNDRDHFVHPTEIVRLGEEKAWKIETLPGTHDDIWANPDPYIKIIKKHYGLLAKTD